MQGKANRKVEVKKRKRMDITRRITRMVQATDRMDAQCNWWRSELLKSVAPPRTRTYDANSVAIGCRTRGRIRRRDWKKNATSSCVG